MNIKIFNNATKQKEEFEPLDPSHIRMYVCGPTVYDRAHIGNGRAAVVFDTFFKLLRAVYPKVTYVRNITDIDDKINKKITETGRSLADITNEVTGYYHDDMGYMNVELPTIEPRATHHIPEMIDLIQRLIDRDHAYEAEGHVLFSVKSMETYGQFSNRSLDDMIAGARVEVAPYKKYAGDFVLWKPSDAETPGWDSPWGRGRPGWHLECSAMSIKYLGQDFDIHGGGEDLVFPHHENEIAQSCCAYPGSKFAKYWVHNSHLIVGGEKMSKSLGNFFTVHDLKSKYPGEVLRCVLLYTHYRQKLDITDEKYNEAWQVLNQLYTSLQNIHISDEELEAFQIDSESPFMQAMRDDLNTSLAIKKLIEISQKINKSDDESEQKDLALALKSYGAIIGLLTCDADEWFRWMPDESNANISEAEIVELITKRNEARQEKNFQEADNIRDQLKEKGIILEDKAGETFWKRQQNI